MLARLRQQIGSGLALLVIATLLISGPALARVQSPARAPQLAAPLKVPGVVDTETFDLCASTGTVTMPDTTVINIWGFSLDTDPGTGVTCDPAQLPGPVLVVDEGDTVIVNLANSLSENVSILFPGQDLVPDTVGAGGGGGTTSYTFTASNPGTYLYESATNTGVQIPMGLYGALVVKAATPGQAYNDLDGHSTYDAEAVLVLSEIDPNLNNYSTGPNDFNLLNYHPTYWLINGEAYDDTVDPGPILASANDRVLLRYLNAGSEHHTMATLGMHQRVIAKDAFLLQFPFDVLAETIPAGATADMIATVPSGALVGDKFFIYNSQMHLTNGDLTSSAHFPGGMMTFINVP